MANNYTQTSFMVYDLAPPEKDWLKQQLDENDRKMEEDDNWDDYIGISYEFEEADDGKENIWLYAEESFFPEPLVNMLQTFLKEHRPMACIHFCWSSTCSKMRIDEFSGGGVFITAKKQKWFSPWYEVQELAKKHEDKREKTETTP